MWINVVEPGRPQMTMQSLPIACWIPEATNTHSRCVIRIAFPLQQRLHERASMLRYRYIECLVIFELRNVLSACMYCYKRYELSVLTR